MAKIYHIKQYPDCYKYRQNNQTKFGYRFSYQDALKKRHTCKRKGFTSVAKCWNAMHQRKYLLSHGQTKTTSIKDYFPVFLQSKKLHCKKSTWMTYLKYFRHNIIPYLGNLQIGKLTPQLMDSMCMEPLIKRHLRHQTLNKVSVSLSTMLNFAVKNGVIDRNPLYKYRAPQGAGARQKRIMNRDTELPKFNAALHARHLNDRVAFYALETTGMRIGELLGLEWQDVALVKQTIKIRHTRDQYGLRSPKTPASRRTLKVNTHLIMLLHNYRHQLMNQGIHLKPSSLVLRNLKGDPASGRTISDHLQVILRQAGLARLVHHFTLHTFRHMFASYLIGNGVNIITVSHYLGHANPGVTMSIYANAMPGQHQDLSSMFEDINHK